MTAIKSGYLIVAVFGLLLTLASKHVSAVVSARDDCGNTVTLQQPAQRVVSLAPHITELLFAAGGGDHVVGTSRYSDFPEQANRIPQIGDSHAVDLERVIALRPELLVIWMHGSPTRQVAQLQTLGIPMFCIEAHKLDDIPDSLVRLGKLLGTDQVAQQAALGMRKKLSALSKQYAQQSPVRVFYQIWGKPLYTLNGEHIVSDAIRLCGGRNIFADLKVAAPSVELESVLQADPEAIIGTAERSTSDEGIYSWKRYPILTAVQRENLFSIDGVLLNRAGPRMIDGVTQLCERLALARQHRKMQP